jgi:FtsH-binding integral membrane protein
MGNSGLPSGDVSSEKQFIKPHYIMGAFESQVWENTYGRDEISRRTFNFIYGVSVLAGLGLAAYAATFSYDWAIKGVGFLGLGFLLGCFAVSIIGIVITGKSEEPVFSAIGYALTAAAMGLMVGPYTALYTVESIIKAAIITATATALLTAVGVLIPKSLESWGSYLVGALCVLIATQIGVPLAHYFFGLPLYEETLRWIDWAAIGLFCVIMVYDVNRAQHITATVDNAIDAASALFVTIMNLFIRILAVSGQRKD